MRWWSHQHKDCPKSTSNQKMDTLWKPPKRPKIGVFCSNWTHFWCSLKHFCLTIVGVWTLKVCTKWPTTLEPDFPKMLINTWQIGHFALKRVFTLLRAKWPICHVFINILGKTLVMDLKHLNPHMVLPLRVSTKWGLRWINISYQHQSPFLPSARGLGVVMKYWSPEAESTTRWWEYWRSKLLQYPHQRVVAHTSYKKP